MTDAAQVRDWLIETNDVNALVAAHPEANDWFIAGGYRFEFGIAGDMYILSDERVAFGPRTGPSAPTDLLFELLDSLCPNARPFIPNWSMPEPVMMWTAAADAEIPF